MTYQTVFYSKSNNYRREINIFHILWVLIKKKPSRGAFNEYQQHMFSLKNKKNINSFNPFMPSTDSSIFTLDKSISYIRSVSLVFISIMFCRNFCLMQTVQTLIRQHILWCLIWVYTVCQCPFYGMLGLNGFCWKKVSYLEKNKNYFL